MADDESSLKTRKTLGVVLSLLTLVVALLLVLWSVHFVASDSSNVPEFLMSLSTRAIESGSADEIKLLSKRADSCDAIRVTDVNTGEIFHVKSKLARWRELWNEFASEEMQRLGLTKLKDWATAERLYENVKRAHMAYYGVTPINSMKLTPLSKQARVWAEPSNDEGGGGGGRSISSDYSYGDNLLEFSAGGVRKEEPNPSVRMNTSYHATGTSGSYERQKYGSPTTMSRLRLVFRDDGGQDLAVPEWYVDQGKTNYFGQPIRLLFEVFELSVSVTDEQSIFSVPPEQLAGDKVMEMTAQVLNFSETVPCKNYHALVFGIDYVCKVWQNTKTTEQEDVAAGGVSNYDTLLYVGLVRLNSFLPPLIPCYVLRDSMLASYTTQTEFETEWADELFTDQYVERYPLLVPSSSSALVKTMKPTIEGHYFLRTVEWDEATGTFSYDVEADGVPASITTLVNPCNTRQTFYFFSVSTTVEDVGTVIDRLPDLSSPVDTRGGWLVKYRNPNGDEFFQVYSIASTLSSYAEQGYAVTVKNALLREEFSAGASFALPVIRTYNTASKIGAVYDPNNWVDGSTSVPPRDPSFFRRPIYLGLDLDTRALSFLMFELPSADDQTQLLLRAGSLRSDASGQTSNLPQLVVRINAADPFSEAVISVEVTYTQGVETAGDVVYYRIGAVVMRDDTSRAVAPAYFKAFSSSTMRVKQSQSVLDRLERQKREFNNRNVAGAATTTISTPFFMNGHEQMEPISVTVQMNARVNFPRIFYTDDPVETEQILNLVPHISNPLFPNGLPTVNTISVVKIYPMAGTSSTANLDFFFFGGDLGNSGTIFVSSWRKEYAPFVNPDDLALDSIQILDVSAGTVIPTEPNTQLVTQNYVVGCSAATKTSSDSNFFDMEVMSGPITGQKLQALTLEKHLEPTYGVDDSAGSGNFVVGFSAQLTHIKSAPLHASALYTDGGSADVESGILEEVELVAVYVAPKSGGDEFYPVLTAVRIPGKINTSLFDATKYTGIVKPEDLCMFSVPTSVTSGSYDKIIMLDDSSYVFRTKLEDDNDKNSAILSFLTTGTFNSISTLLAAKFVDSATDIVSFCRS